MLMAIYHSRPPRSVRHRPPLAPYTPPPRRRLGNVTMNHNRDANVPIYLVPTLLRLTFSQREGNERPRPFTLLSRARLSLSLSLCLVRASIYTSMRVVLPRVCVRACVYA